MKSAKFECRSESVTSPCILTIEVDDNGDPVGWENECFWGYTDVTPILTPIEEVEG